jgi:RHS repeat-associated protein
MCFGLCPNGQIISYEEYHPFGTTSYQSGRTETKVSLKRYKYCGKERDEQTGFYYYGMRYYAGWLCRFVSVDPMADEYLSLTPYAYCMNNPIMFVDPDGRDVIPSAALKGSLPDVKAIVLHRTVSSTTESTINAFKVGRNGVNYGTHFVVGKDGKILQTAHLDQKTYHVGKTREKTDPNNSNSIGIEVVGNYNAQSKAWEELTPEQIDATANLVNYLLSTFGLDGNKDVYVHEKISYKTKGEGQVVLYAIKDKIETKNEL